MVVVLFFIIFLSLISETGSNNFVLEVTPQPEARTVAINFPSRYLGDKLTSYSLPMSLDVAAPFYVAQSVQVTAVLEIVGMFSPFRRATVESHVIDLSQELSTVEVSTTHQIFLFPIVGLLVQKCISRWLLILIFAGFILNLNKINNGTLHVTINYFCAFVFTDVLDWSKF